MNEKYTLVDVLRHGACEGGEIFRGVTDVRLTESGWQQMEATVRQYCPQPDLYPESKAQSENRGWDRVITSPLQRCHAFAQRHANQLGLPLSVDEDWREINFGIWEGQQISRVWESDTEMIGRYFSDPGSVTPEGGEPMEAARQRVIRAWENALAQYPYQRLLIVQHAGTIRLLLTHLTGSPLSAASRFNVSYASLSRIKVYHQGERHFPVLMAHFPGADP